jgi:hypothetical protein
MPRICVGSRSGCCVSRSDVGDVGDGRGGSRDHDRR